MVLSWILSQDVYDNDFYISAYIRSMVMGQGQGQGQGQRGMITIQGHDHSHRVKVVVKVTEPLINT